MTDAWRSVPLSDLAEVATGKGIRREERLEDGPVPIFGANGVIGYTVEPLLAEPAVIVGRVGAYGAVNLAPVGSWVSDNALICCPRQTVPLKFLQALLETVDYDRLVHGTTQPLITQSGLRAYEVLVPPLEEQCRIATVIEALDDRIESAARLEKVLGETVLAEYGLALLDRAEEEVVSLVDAVSLINGGAYTKGADGTGRMVIRIKELNSGPSESTVYSSSTVPDNKTAYPGDVLFAWSGSLGVWRWYRDEAIVNQHIFKVLPKKHPVWLGWIHILEELERFQDIAAGKATTMGHITKDHLERTMVPTFSAEELEVLSSRVEPLWEAQLQAGRELHTLHAVRAQLLPALVSGELRVAAAEELVEAAT